MINYVKSVEPLSHGVPRLFNSYKSKSKNKINDVNVIIIAPVMTNFDLEESQITYENQDYINRKPYHQYDNGKIMNISNIN